MSWQGWPETPKNHPKITYFGWFSGFSSFFGHKWPHFGSPTNLFWVKTDRGPLKHCFPSIYHGYHTLLVKNHLKYTVFVKIRKWSLFSEKGCVKRRFREISVVCSIFLKEMVYYDLQYSGVHGTLRYVPQKPEIRFIFSKFWFFLE